MISEAYFTDDQYIPNERRRFLEKVDNRLAIAYDITIATLIRLVFLIQGSFFIYYLIADSGSYGYLALILGIVMMFADLIFILMARKGKEHLWFSISSFFYIIIILVTIWYIVLKKYDIDDLDCTRNNSQIIDQNFWLYNVIELCNFLELIVVIFILTCIFSRWFYPMHMSLKREALLNMIISFITNGTDMVDFFTYVDEKHPSENKTLILAILTLFSISCIQFSFTLSATVAKSEKEKVSIGRRIFELFFGTELWSILLIFWTMDFPFLITRCYVITHYGVEKNYLLYYLVVKNFFLCILEIYITIQILLNFRHEQNTKKKVEKSKSINL